jgi:hypothetical protein
MLLWCVVVAAAAVAGAAAQVRPRCFPRPPSRGRSMRCTGSVCRH